MREAVADAVVETNAFMAEDVVPEAGVDPPEADDSSVELEAQGIAETVLMARQPIFDRDSQVVGYELLFRNDTGDAANVVDGDLSSSQVLLNAFTHFGIDQVVGEHRAFVNFTRHLLKNPPAFAKSRLVIEILESERVDDELVCAVRKLSEEGYTIALDDFVLQPGWEGLLELADVVKVDVLDPAVTDLESMFKKLSKYPCKLLAEKVEDSAMYERCKALGFDLFQGYFLSRPQIMKGKEVPSSKMLVLEVLNALRQPDMNTDTLEHLIVRDPVLVHKLLSLVNSAAFVTVRKIESINWAITYLGLNNIRSMVSLLMLSRLPEKPVALRQQALQRARMCELIGGAYAPSRRATLFSVGLLSLLGAFFDSTLAHVLSRLAVSEEINLALLEHEGFAGHIIKLVLTLENGNWDDLDDLELSQYGITTELINKSFLDAIEWADEMANSLN